MKKAPQLKTAEVTTKAKKITPSEKLESAPALPAPEAVSSLAFSALAISNAADTILRNADAKVGLADWALLSRLGATPEGQPMGRLDTVLGVTRQRIQKQTDELQRAGLVNVYALEGDKRSRHVSLTPAGKEALTATLSVWTAWFLKTPELGEMKGQDVILRRVERLANSLNRTLRSESREAISASQAAKPSSEAPKVAG
jgi:DNA-binding MarR family transcriptional regulator